MSGEEGADFEAIWWGEKAHALKNMAAEVQPVHDEFQEAEAKWKDKFAQLATFGIILLA